MNIFCPPYPPSFYQYWSTFPQGQTIASIIIEPSCVILRNAHGLADKMPPCPPENRGKPGEAAALHPWGYGIPGDGEGRCGPGGGGVWRPGGLRPPGLPNKKLRPVAKPPASAFQGASRPAAAPPRKPRRDSLSAGNVADAPKKGEVPAKALPPVMAVSPISPRQCVFSPAHPAGSPPCHPGRRLAVRPGPCASSGRPGSARRAGWYAPGL